MPSAILTERRLVWHFCVIRSNMIDLTVVGNKALSKEDMFKLAIKQDDLGLLLETLKIQDVKNKEMIKAAKKAYSKALKKTNESAKAKKIKEALEWYDLARNINGKMDIGYNNAMRIVRTEGHRIQSASALDAMYAAKEKGADVVKQWDSTLDGKTRDSHRRLDGQLRELDKDFEVDGKTAPAPGYFSSPKEDCNCRCVLLQRARWALDDDELKTLQERAEYFGLDKSLDFEDFKEKYLKAVDISEDSGIIKTGKSSVITEPLNFKQFNNGDEVNEFFGGKGGILQKKKSAEKQWLKSLTKDETAYIGDYTADGYDDVNKYLRKIDDDINEAYAKASVKNIDSAISKFEITDNITVYRGIDVDVIGKMFPDAENFTDLIGKQYTDKGYMSSSPLKSVAEEFADENGQNGVMMMFDIPKGKGHGAYINKLAGQHQNIEYEFLIKRNSKFEIYEVDENGDIPILKARWLE